MPAQIFRNCFRNPVSSCRGAKIHFERGIGVIFFGIIGGRESSWLMVHGGPGGGSHSVLVLSRPVLGVGWCGGVADDNRIVPIHKFISMNPYLTWLAQFEKY